MDGPSRYARAILWAVSERGQVFGGVDNPEAHRKARKAKRHMTRASRRANRRR